MVVVVVEVQLGGGDEWDWGLRVWDGLYDYEIMSSEFSIERNSLL